MIFMYMYTWSWWFSADCLDVLCVVQIRADMMKEMEEMQSVHGDRLKQLTEEKKMLEQLLALVHKVKPALNATCL